MWSLDLAGSVAVEGNGDRGGGGLAGRTIVDGDRIFGSI